MKHQLKNCLSLRWKEENFVAKGGVGLKVEGVDLHLEGAMKLSDNLLGGFATSFGVVEGRFKEYNCGLKFNPSESFDVAISHISTSEQEYKFGNIVLNTLLKVSETTKLFSECIYQVPSMGTTINLGMKHRFSSNLSGKIKVSVVKII